MSRPTPAEAQICEVLRGTPGIYRDLPDAASVSGFIETAAEHRLRPLLSWLLRRSGEIGSWPEPVRASLVATELTEAAIEVWRQRELNRVLQAFDDARIQAIVFKGAALALTAYPEPWLRPREDADILVRPADRESARAVLHTAGYEAAPQVTGDLVKHQCLYWRHEQSGLRHDVDLHWKTVNPLPLADLVSADELLSSSESLLVDRTAVRVAGPLHALFVACLHRAAHHHGSSNLLWLYDIHLLCQRLDEGRITELKELTRRTGAGAICAQGIGLAAERFVTRLPPGLVESLESSDRGGLALPTVYVESGTRKADLLLADLQSIDGWRGRLRLVREHLFPPAEYLLGRHPRASRALLPVLYLWRIVRGVKGWFRPL